jgi:predicted nucleic acid-binding protein
VSAIYLETSALLRWLLGESESARVRGTLNDASAVVTSSLTYVETERALRRAQSEGSLAEADAQRLRGLLARARTGWFAMALTQSVLERAGRVFPVEPVRTLDALHLATALEFTQAHADLRVLTFDKRIADNAESLGIG